MKYIILCLLLILSYNSFGQSKLKGTITYFFNNYQGDKADIGANVFVLDSVKAIGYDENLFNDFKSASSNKSIYDNYTSMYDGYAKETEKIKGKKKHQANYDYMISKMETYKKEMDIAYKHLLELNSDTSEKFKTLDTENYKNLFKITDLNKNTIKTIADGNGNFNLELTPGTYYVIIRSNGRKGYTISEVQGLLKVEKINILENKTAEVNSNFR